MCNDFYRSSAQKKTRSCNSYGQISLLSIYFEQSTDNTGLQKKKFPRIIFQFSVSFSPAEYEYENHFFQSRLDFSKKYDKGLKINKRDCFRLFLC